MSNIAFIPARIGSTRLPNKLLLNETGQPLFTHVIEQIKKTSLIDQIIVATDSKKIAKIAERWDTLAILTDPNIKNGTERIGAAAQQLNINDNDTIINVQGDEPDIEPSLIDNLITAKNKFPCFIFTACFKINKQNDIMTNSIVKIVKGNKIGEVNKKAISQALYFSRLPIPYNSTHQTINYFAHIGIYVFDYLSLQSFCKLEPSHNAQSEQLEQLKALDNNKIINVLTNNQGTIGIDTPTEYDNFVKSKNL